MTDFRHPMHRQMIREIQKEGETLMTVLDTMLSRFFSHHPPPNLITRINRYRGAGHAQDGLHTLQGYQVDDLDYALMGADCSCARIANGGKDATTGEWFAIQKGTKLSRMSIGNSHGRSDDGGKTYYNENGYLSIPRPEFQVSPEEVVWHHVRVTELRGQGVEQPERVRIMTEERASKPWLK